MKEKDEKQKAVENKIDWNVKLTLITAIASVVSTLVSMFVIYQNSQSIKTAQESFALSVPPTVNIDFPIIGSTSDSITLQSTSPFAIVNLELYSVCYVVSKGDSKITARYQSSAINSTNRLGPRERFDLNAGSLISECNSQLPPNLNNADVNVYRSLILVFHREIDNKRFVKIEPFAGHIEDNEIYIFPLYSSKFAPVGGYPYKLIDVVKEIESTEKLFFRVEN